MQRFVSNFQFSSRCISLSRKFCRFFDAEKHHSRWKNITLLRKIVVFILMNDLLDLHRCVYTCLLSLYFTRFYYVSFVKVLYFFN